MTDYQHSGFPQTLNVEADSVGTCVRLRQWSTSLYIQANAPATIYWTKKDFDADQNGMVISGDQPHVPIHLNAAAANVWVRGRGATSQVSITAIGGDG